MKIKISQYTPRKPGGTIVIPEVSILTRKINPENITKTYLNTDALHAMKEDNLQEIVPRIRIALARRRTTKEDIILTL